MSGEVAIVASTGGALGHATAATLAAGLDIGPRTHGIRVNAVAPQLLDTPPTGPPSRPR